MGDPIRLRRSVLYVPAANERAMTKAAGLSADVILIDLEDSVAPDAKHAAREAAVNATVDGRFGDLEVVIRANGLDTAWGAEDLRAVAGSRAHAVVIPKVASTDDLDAAGAILADAAAPADLPIWPMIETPAGFLNCAAIAAHPRTDVLVIGTNDLAFALRAQIAHGRDALIPHLAHALLAARAAGRPIVDGAHVGIGDEEGLRSECRQGRAMGFDGKTVTHPSQIAIVNATWTPSAADVDHALRVIAAFDDAIADGAGVAVVDGRLVEHLHATEARRIVAVAEAADERSRASDR